MQIFLKVIRMISLFVLFPFDLEFKLRILSFLGLEFKFFYGF